MSDVAYYHRRLREERELAKTATDPAVVKVHEEVAALYQKMIDALEGRIGGAGQ